MVAQDNKNGRGENLKKTLDLTEGNIWKKMLLFALPLLGTSFIQQLYNTVDLLVVGNLLGKEAHAAVGASSLLTTCVVGFFTGLSVGCGVMTAQARGAGDRRKLDRILHTAMGVSLAGGAILSVLGVALARQFLVWMNAPEEILAPGAGYARIYLMSMIPMCIYNIYAGVMRALGDSEAPMRMQLWGGVINVVMDLVLVKLLPDGIYGVALATLFSQSAAAVLAVRYLRRGTEFGRLDLSRIRLEGEIVGEIARLGVPAGLQSLVITLSNVFVQSAVNWLGVDAIAGFAAYFKVELLIYMPIVALGSAMMTFSGQCCGAGNIRRISEGVRVCIAMGVAYVAVMSALLYFFGQYAFMLFTRDPGVIESGMRIVHVTFPLSWSYVFLQIFAEAARGKGKTLQPMLIILATICVFRTVCLMIFTRSGVTIERVAAVYPAAWFAAAVCLFLFWMKERRREAFPERMKL